jgi:hypothetical protein
MSMDLGGIEYNEKEYLNKGAEFKEATQELNVAGKAELNIIDLKKEDEEKEEETEEKILEKSEMEAKAVANRIRKLFEDNYCVYDKKEGYRKATFKDIVILLRTTSDTASHIRAGRITREEGIELIKRYDGEFPKKYLDTFLQYCDITKEELDSVLDSWRSDHLWEKVDGQWQLKNPIWKEKK